MNSLVLVIVAILAFLVAYVTYGGYLVKKLGINDDNKTPAHTMNDGVDYVPAKAPVLLGHHFASIAGAAPIIGPITAAIFGWVPAFLWIVLGGIFFGAVHDFTSIVASIRHKGKTIGVIINDNIGITGKKLFNIFAWLTLILVIAAFTIITARTFAATPEAGTASILFLVVAVIYGFTVYRNNIPIVLASIIGIALLVFSIWFGLRFPIELDVTTWVWILLVYIIIASVTPVWALLQPRDYLNSFLLYAMLGGAVIGLFLYQPTIQMEAFNGFHIDGKGYLFPILFVTIACGAISGFHSLVASGTTAKQINKESDAKIIGYGGMLLESLLAVVALITAIMIIPSDYLEAMNPGGAGPVAVFSSGVGAFLGKLGISMKVGKSFTALVVSAFALTSLDTATRLSRYIFQEFFEDSSKAVKSIGSNAYVATIVSVAAGGALALSDQWAAIWPIFGSANQLLAALALLAISVWLAKLGKNNRFTKYPMYFMFAVTLTALVQLAYTNFGDEKYVLAVLAVLLFILALILALFANHSLKKVKNNQVPK